MGSDEKYRGGKNPVKIGSSGKFYGKCDVRLSKQEDLDLTRLAERNGVTRSDVMRRALADFIKFNSHDDE